MDSVPKFDPEKTCGIYGELNHGIPARYFAQEGHLFDMQTKEFVRALGADRSEPVTFQSDPVTAAAETIVCKECGKPYKVGTTPQSRALAVSHMRKHLQNKHGIELKSGSSQ